MNNESHADNEHPAQIAAGARWLSPASSPTGSASRLGSDAELPGEASSRWCGCDRPVSGSSCASSKVALLTCTWPLADEPAHMPAPAPAPCETLRFAEALALVGVSRNTLYRLAAEGRIPGVQRIGKTWRFHRETLLHFLAHPELHRPRRRR